MVLDLVGASPALPGERPATAGSATSRRHPVTPGPQDRWRYGEPMTVDLGRLEPVDPRTVWPHEAQHFTPWLLEHADVLSDVLGMDLELKAAEHRVGEFSLDLIGTDQASGERVIVENQLDQSDHAHLGQILTYAGGTDPTNVIWVATGFREEHRAALEWLNERTDERTRFFAVLLQTVRISGSPPAPLLTPVVRPNDWGKQVRATTTSGRSRSWTENDFRTAIGETGDEQLIAFADRLYEHTRAAAPGAWTYFGEGRRPSMTAQIPIGPVTLQPWSLYLDGAPGGGAVLAVNFEWIYKGGRGVDDETVEAFAEQVRAIPAIAPYVAQARAAGWRKRPSVPVARLLDQPGAPDTLIAALDQLYASLRDTRPAG